MLRLDAYPQSVGHGRKKSDKASTNCTPCEDALLPLGVVEEGLQGLLRNPANYDKSAMLSQTGSSDSFKQSVSMSLLDNASCYCDQVHTVML